MFSYSFSEYIFFLAIYSVIGWVCETVYCSVGAKKFVNRGFLSGPYCPVYGIGALVILAVTTPFTNNPFMVFALSLAAATALEFLTGWLLETIFQTRWWDYSGRKFQLGGRICLRNSIIFGLLGLAVTYILHPLIDKQIVSQIGHQYHQILVSLILIVFFFDLLRTLSTIFGLSERLRNLQSYLTELKEYNKEYAWLDLRDIPSSVERLRDICRRDADNATSAAILSHLDALISKGDRSFRILKAYPRLDTKGLSAAVKGLRKSWEGSKKKLSHQIKDIAKGFGRKTKSTAKKMKTFAQGTSFYKMIWLFVIASVLGYVIEIIYCYVTKGIIESRQGLLYGPFSQIYGFGAVLMVLLLNPLAKKQDRWLFLGGFALGGFFEFICSLIQEHVFGTISWEYSHKPLSIGGRTDLTYMFFWGVLSVVFIKGIYPKLSALIEQIPKKQGVFLSWILIIGLSIDMLLSAAAVGRWATRVNDVPATNAIQEFLDIHYPNDVMEEIYPNMTMVHKSKP